MRKINRKSNRNKMSQQRRKAISINVIDDKKDDTKVTVDLGKVKPDPQVIDMTKNVVKNTDKDIDIASLLKGNKGITIYHVVYCDVTLSDVVDNCIEFYKKIDPINTISDMVNCHGKKYDEGECLIFPSKNQRDWSKFKKEEFKPGSYVVIGNIRCIYKGVRKMDDKTFFECFVAIASEDDIYPNKVVLNHILKENKIRRATYDEVAQMNKILLDNGVKWNPDTHELDSAKWYPKQDETYYSLLIKGACRFFVTEAKWDGNSIDIDRLENGNCFQTKEEANHWCAKFNNSSDEVSKQLINR